jgi:predicted HTH transcriptional regulator
MKPQELFRLIQHGESETLELKPSLGKLREIVETVGAFANASGGTILVGLSPQKEIIGVQVGTNTLESLANTIKQNTDPAVLPSISTVQVEGKQVIVLQIEESSVKPVLAYNKPFKRVGRSNHILSSSEMAKLVLESDSTSWDAGIVEGIDLSLIGDRGVRKFLTAAVQERNLNIEPQTPIPEALEKLGLLREEKLTRAGVLLFGKYPQGEFLQSQVRCARFKGTKPRNKLIAHAFFLIKYIEQWGTGTIRMMEACRTADFSEPEFAEMSGSFVVSFHKLRFTEEYLEKLGLTERQRRAVEYVRAKEKIINREYVDLTGVSRPTATRDLTELVKKGILKQHGHGKGSYFEMVLEK